MNMGACVVCDAPVDGKPGVALSWGSLYRCSRCGTLTHLPRRDATAQAAIHQANEYFEHPYLELRRANVDAVRRRCRDLFSKIGRVVEVSMLRGEPHLDVGCDTGLLLEAARDAYGTRPIGVDIAPKPVEMARARGLEAYAVPLEDAPAHVTGMAVVTAVDLIEHVPSPRAFLSAMALRMRPGGVCYLETPNIASIVYRIGRLASGLMNGRPAGWLDRLYPPEHVQYFSVDGLRTVASHSGLQLAAVGTRTLPASEIAVGAATRAALAALQSADRASGQQLLLWAVLQRPA